MEPTAIGGAPASGLIVSLLKRLFPADGPEAGLATRTVRLGEIGRTEMDRDRTESIVAEILPAVAAASVLGDAAAVLDHFLARAGLLLSPAPDTLHLVHRTFPAWSTRRKSTRRYAGTSRTWPAPCCRPARRRRPGSRPRPASMPCEKDPAR
ncbi:hypothetical protein [Streptomyces echinatus]|uniref:hypothetical protein n=1 Tax=Streptomyces echinatus TaxID=67293 RepID=UPI00378F230D